VSGARGGGWGVGAMAMMWAAMMRAAGELGAVAVSGDDVGGGSRGRGGMRIGSWSDGGDKAVR